MVVAAAGIALAVGFGGPLDPDPVGAGRTSAAGGPAMASTSVDLAVVPVRPEAGARLRPGADPTRHGPARWLLPLMAALVGVAGYVGSRSRVARPPVGGHPPLRTRRHAIALRAPPSPLV
jgi:hypothetical protein